MPVIHGYTDSPGIYVVGKLRGGFITYQVSPRAEEALSAKGYGEGSTLSWALCRRLAADGHLYTYKTGVWEIEPPDGDEPLSPAEAAVAGELDDDPPEIDVPDSIRTILSDWLDHEITDDELRTLFREAKRVEWCFSSIRGFAATCTPARFTVNAGMPTYHFESPVRWVIEDRRYSRDGAATFFVTASTGGDSVTLQTTAGGLRQWEISSEYAEDAPVEIVVELLPVLFDLLDRLPGSRLDVGNWHFRDGKRIKLTADQTERIGAALHDLAAQYGLGEGPATGALDSMEYAGYGRIHVDGTDATIPFNSRQFAEPGIRPGDRVTFDIETVKSSYYAKRIHRAA